MTMARNTSPGIRRNINPTLWAAGLCVGALAGLISISCYKPTFGMAIYKCDVYACPAGTVCNSDGFCVYHPMIGCGNGGINIDNNLVICPGTSNRCADGFALCTAVPEEYLCQPPAKLDAGNLTCRPCCRM